MRKHRDIIKQWADGATIQIRLNNGEWVDCPANPGFYDECTYRVKPNDHFDDPVKKMTEISQWVFENSPGYAFKIETGVEAGYNASIAFKFYISRDKMLEFDEWLHK